MDAESPTTECDSLKLLITSSFVFEHKEAAFEHPSARQLVGNSKWISTLTLISYGI